MKNVSVVLPYANPHVLDWVLKMEEVNLNIGCFKSTQVYRPGYFFEYDEIDNVKYFYKSKQALTSFTDELKGADVLITLGIFDVNLLRLRKYCKKDVKVIVMSEPFNSINSTRKIFLRKLWSLVFRNFFTDISFFCMGGTAVKDYYEELGFVNSKYYNFGYFPDLKFSKPILKNKCDIVKLGFLGQFIPRKGVDRLIDLITYLSNTEFKFEFEIVGDGFLKDNILSTLNGLDDKRFYYSGLANSKAGVEIFLEGLDILFVPSYFDGWGAVINEALSKSCAIVSSNQVFAARSIFGERNSCVFETDYVSIFDSLLSSYVLINEMKINNCRLFDIWNSSNAANEVECFLNQKDYEFKILNEL
ncbi:glycosyltransferase family 4 protein [Myroides odoratimimus]|uniref:glycosyltransferase n=1 Tax=Myroides odoratimimus TaxID=76832 RepID=UPI00257621CF|nr:glycosyltransferase [Myroides odoratimimus]MDM1033764.1 glycosyltransferase family 4 protein [Myroides odoratimimus]